MAIHFSRVGRPLKAPFSVRYFGRFLADELLVRRREGDTRRYPQQQSLQLGIISPSVLSFQLPSSNLYRHITAKVLSPPPRSPHTVSVVWFLCSFTLFTWKDIELPKLEVALFSEHNTICWKTPKPRLWEFTRSSPKTTSRESKNDEHFNLQVASEHKGKV